MVVGCRGTVTLNPRYLMLPEASIRGVALGNSTSSEYREMGSAIVAGIEAGWVDPVNFTITIWKPDTFKIWAFLFLVFECPYTFLDENVQFSEATLEAEN